MGGGHYTAHGLNARNNKWYNFNDGYVSDAREGDCVNRGAYVLFYRRRLPGAAPLPPLPAAPAGGAGAAPADDGSDDEGMH